MSLAATPFAREQLSPFSVSSLTQEFTNQQVPGSPLSPFLTAHFTGGGTSTRRPSQRGVVYSPSSGSPLAQVPDGGSPLLRHLLACRKRKREDGTPSPSPSSKRSSRDSPRVPNSIIIVRRAAPPRLPNKDEQVVPSTPVSQPEGSSDSETRKDTYSTDGGRRTLPEKTDSTKLLDLFGDTSEIFASTHEE